MNDYSVRENAGAQAGRVIPGTRLRNPLTGPPIAVQVVRPGYGLVCRRVVQQAVHSSTIVSFRFPCRRPRDGGEDTNLLDRALQDRQVLMVPVVLTEILSDPSLPPDASQPLLELPLVEVEHGYWQRAGELRARVLARCRKARLDDALIAQSCIDRGIALLTRDRDFRAFAETAGLDLIIGSAQ
ncbi:MAG: PIN domain-containing protein [Acidobacteriales bacterium]|nr:PIN domain-containing protein [Terriglobales bacterium]